VVPKYFLFFFVCRVRPPPSSPLFPYTTLFRSRAVPIARCPRCRAEDISADAHPTRLLQNGQTMPVFVCRNCFRPAELEFQIACRSEEHTSELQSRSDLVCRLLLEKKNASSDVD